MRMSETKEILSTDETNWLFPIKEGDPIDLIFKSGAKRIAEKLEDAYREHLNASQP